MHRCMHTCIEYTASSGSVIAGTIAGCSVHRHDDRWIVADERWESGKEFPLQASTTRVTNAWLSSSRFLGLLLLAFWARIRRLAPPIDHSYLRPAVVARKMIECSASVVYLITILRLAARNERAMELKTRSEIFERRSTFRLCFGFLLPCLILLFFSLKQKLVTSKRRVGYIYIRLLRDPLQISLCLYVDCTFWQKNRWYNNYNRLPEVPKLFFMVK